jgi:hypothetical protein
LVASGDSGRNSEYKQSPGRGKRAKKIIGDWARYENNPDEIAKVQSAG